MKNLSKKLCIVLIPLTLSACGGGSGGVGAISNFIKNDVSSLSGSSTIISSYSNLLTDFQSVISSGDISAIQGVITGPVSYTHLTLPTIVRV